MSAADSETAADLKISALAARPVEVPLRRPLVTGGGAISTVPLVLIDLATETHAGAAGPTGRAYVFCYTPVALRPTAALVANMAALVEGLPLAPLEIEAKLQAAFRLLGPQGLTGIAMGGLDIAAWDALARSAGLPLCRMLGAVPRAQRAYNSNGLGLIGPEKAPEEAAELLAEGGFRAVKVRLGYPDPAEDRAVIEAVRSAVGPGITLMSDYNQSQTLASARARLEAIDDAGLAWIEEPVRADDYESAAALAAESLTPIQIGENAWGVHDMEKALATEATNLFMPDAVKIGGVTGWLRATGLAAPRGLPLSSHLFPEVSAHLLAATATADWLEYVDWAAPVLRRGVSVTDGMVTRIDGPGIGIEWNEEAVQKYMA